MSLASAFTYAALAACAGPSRVVETSALQGVEGGGGQGAGDTYAPILDYQDRYPFGAHGEKKAVLRSDDGTFELGVGGLVQGRYIANFRPEEERRPTSVSQSQDNEAGFEIRRAELGVSGHVERVEYSVVLGTDTGTSRLEEVLAQDIKLAMRLQEGLSISIGRFLVPFLREELVGGQGSLAAALSLANNVLTMGRAEGMALSYGGEDYRAQLFVSDGAMTGDSDAPPRFFDTRTEIAATLRADRRLAGDWSRFSNLSAAPIDETHAFVGAALHYEVAQNGSLGLGSELLGWTADGSLNWAGWTVFGSLTGQHLTRDQAKPRDDYAAVIQLGHRADGSRVEPFARFESIAFERNRGYVSDEANLVTIGANFHVNDRAKWAFDVVRAFDPLPVDSLDAGLLADGVREGQLLLRLQLQLRF